MINQNETVNRISEAIFLLINEGLDVSIKRSARYPSINIEICTRVKEMTRAASQFSIFDDHQDYMLDELKDNITDFLSLIGGSK